MDAEITPMGKVSITLKIQQDGLDMLINAQHDDPHAVVELLAAAKFAALAEFLGESAAHPAADAAGNYPGKRSVEVLMDVVIDPKPLEEGKPEKARVDFYTPLRNGKRGRYPTFFDVKETEQWVEFFKDFHFLHNGQPFVPTATTFQRARQLTPARPSTVTFVVSERRKYDADGTPGYYYIDPVSVQAE